MEATEVKAPIEPATSSAISKEQVTKLISILEEKGPNVLYYLNTKMDGLKKMGHMDGDGNSAGVETIDMIEFDKISGDLMWSPLQKELMNALEKNGPMSRADLVKHCDKPRTTVYDNLMGLIQHNIVKKYSRPTNARGRPLVFFKVDEKKY